VANDITQEGSGFDGDTNIATIIDRGGAARTLPLMTKDELANRIYDHLLTLRDQHLNGYPQGTQAGQVLYRPPVIRVGSNNHCRRRSNDKLWSDRRTQ